MMKWFVIIIITLNFFVALIEALELNFIHVAFNMFTAIMIMILYKKDIYS